MSYKKIKDSEKLEVILNFLMMKENLEINGVIQKIEKDISGELEKLRKENITARDLIEIHMILENKILDLKHELQIKYFKNGIIANEMINNNYEMLGGLDIEI
ncbi:MAG: hypothetical protein ACRCZR_05745 [Cetobacterium sp.]